MKIILKPLHILEFYDIPHLFIGVDQINTKYICLLSSENDERYFYVCTPISQQLLLAFLSGKKDLREIFIQPETETIYFFEIYEATDTFCLSIFDDIIPEEYLPEEGFFQNYIKEFDAIIAETYENKAPTLFLSLKENNENIGVSPEILSEVLLSFQKIIKFAYQKSLSFLKEIEEEYRTSAYYSLNCYKADPGSLNLYFKFNNQFDMFGFSYSVLALDRIDKLIQEQYDEVLLKELKINKGHVINNYKKLLNIILKYDLNFFYEWYVPERKNIIKRIINKEFAQKIIKVLTIENDLSNEEKNFIGYFTKIDINNKTWRLFEEVEKKEYSGGSKVDISFQNITTKPKRYKITCEEIIKEEEITGNEKVSYLITAVSEI